jgi:hydrogenase maturation protease
MIALWDREGPRAARLVLGLGNPLMGDDGVGWRLVARLAAHPCLPRDVEVAWGGTDLLACGSRLRGRQWVVLVDAIESDGTDAPVVLDPLAGELEESAPGAHALSLSATLRLLRLERPELDEVPVRLFAVPVRRVSVGERLSPDLERRLPEITSRLLREIAAG